MEKTITGPLETVRFGRSRVTHALLGDGVAVLRWPTLCDRDTFEHRVVTYDDAGAESVTCRRCLARLAQP